MDGPHAGPAIRSRRARVSRSGWLLLLICSSSRHPPRNPDSIPSLACSPCLDPKDTKTIYILVKKIPLCDVRVVKIVRRACQCDVTSRIRMLGFSGCRGRIVMALALPGCRADHLPVRSSSTTSRFPFVLQLAAFAALPDVAGTALVCPRLAGSRIQPPPPPTFRLI